MGRQRPPVCGAARSQCSSEQLAAQGRVGADGQSERAAKARQSIRRAYRCPCDGHSHRETGRPTGGLSLAVVSELDTIEASTKERPDTCPWWAFHDPDVHLVLRAYDCIAGDSGSDELLHQFWGDDPPYWMVLGLHHFKAQVERVRAESFRLYQEELKTKRAHSAPTGYEPARPPETF